MSKIAFYAGHGGNDNGATGVSGLHEDDLALSVAKECCRIANGVGHSTIINRTSDVRSEINDKVKFANNNKVDALIEIHLNASDGTGFGTETYYDHTGAVSKRLATEIDKQLVDEGFRDRGIKIKLLKDGSDDYFGVIRQSNAPAVLVEICFIDNSADMAKFNATKAAQAIVDGVLAVFPAPKKIVPASPAKPINKYPEPKRILKKGMTGEDVKYLQWELAQAGYKITIDGVFGEITRGIVRSYQNWKKLKVDGIAGVKTIASLKAS